MGLRCHPDVTHGDDDNCDDLDQIQCFTPHRVFLFLSESMLIVIKIPIQIHMQIQIHFLIQIQIQIQIQTQIQYLTSILPGLTCAEHVIGDPPRVAA